MSRRRCLAVVTKRVERVLFDHTAASVWRRFDATTLEVEVHSAHNPGDIELLDRLVVWARGNGAEIVATDFIADGRPLLPPFATDLDVSPASA